MNLRHCEVAEDICEILKEEGKDLNELRRRILAGKIIRWLEKNGWVSLPKVVEESSFLEPMKDQESHEFEEKILPFGKFKGKSMGDTPLDYLEWLCEYSREQTKQLARYLNSERVARER